MTLLNQPDTMTGPYLDKHRRWNLVDETGHVRARYRTVKAAARALGESLTNTVVRETREQTRERICAEYRLHRAHRISLTLPVTYDDRDINAVKSPKFHTSEMVVLTDPGDLAAYLLVHMIPTTAHDLSARFIHLAGPGEPEVTDFAFVPTGYSRSHDHINGTNPAAAAPVDINDLSCYPVLAPDGPGRFISARRAFAQRVGREVREVVR